MKKINVIIVDDHKIFRTGFKLLLSEIEDIGTVSEASNGKEFLEMISKNKPNIVFMDISMPVMGGIEASSKALELYPDLKIIVLSTFGDENYFNKMTDIGVKGFLLKNSDVEEFKKAVYLVNNDCNYFSNELMINLSKKLAHYQKTEKIKERLNLNENEIQIIKLLSHGLSSYEIADEMCLSRRTIEGYRTKMLQKTNTNNTTTLVIYAIKNNIIEV